MSTESDMAQAEYVFHRAEDRQELDRLRTIGQTAVVLRNSQAACSSVQFG